MGAFSPGWEVPSVIFNTVPVCSFAGDAGQGQQHNQAQQQGPRGPHVYLNLFSPHFHTMLAVSSLFSEGGCEAQSMTTASFVPSAAKPALLLYLLYWCAVNLRACGRALHKRPHVSSVTFTCGPGSTAARYAPCMHSQHAFPISHTPAFQIRSSLQHRRPKRLPGKRHAILPRTPAFRKLRPDCQFGNASQSPTCDPLQCGVL